MNFISVYVGKFNKVPDTKKTVAKLNANGYRGYVFSLGDFYSLRVGAFATLEMADKCCRDLVAKGFDAFVR